MRGSRRRLWGEQRSRERDREAVSHALAEEERETGELRERIAQQWAELRATRRAMDEFPDITGGRSNMSRAQVPYGVDLAAAWSWRFVVICAAGAIVLYLLSYFLVVVFPVLVALLLAALASPAVSRLQQLRLPRRLSALAVVLLGLGLVALLVTFVGTQVAQGMGDLSEQVASGLGQIRDWLRTGPLDLTDSQLNAALSDAQAQIQQFGAEAVGRLTEVGTAVGHVVAGLFIVLFATYFFLADGPLIWAWIVRLFPRAARLRADSSGRVAWTSLTSFVRATVLVAATDAVGIMIWAAVLQVPFVSAIGVLVFLGAFVPMIGATISGTVAVLVALVANGPVSAAFMLLGVIVVQQIEAHILQPFLLGRFVSVHPLGVIVAIAMGVIVAGIPGALIAVPLAASLNAVVQHLAAHTEVGEDAAEAGADDPGDAPLPAAASGEHVADQHDPDHRDGRSTP